MRTFNLHVRNLSKRYGTNRVFNDISFAHSEGVLGIAGPNGSGKSTLLQCLASLQRPTSGTVEWQLQNEPLDALSLKKYIGYAAPYINLYAELSCKENLQFLLKLRGNTNKDLHIIKTLDKTGIKPLASQPFGKLSTGQQQRLRLAAALAHNPEVLFLDEPGSNLDKDGRELINELVASFSNAGKIVVVSTNTPAELELCDRVYSVENEHFL